MSSFLELAQKLRQETTDSGTGPATVIGQTGQLARFVQWTADAWKELQLARRDWRWMRKSFTVNTAASDSDYLYSECTDTVTAVAIARWRRWYRQAFKCYLQSTGVGAEYPLAWLDWERFRRIYRYGTQTDGQPTHVSEDPTGAFVLGPAPDAVYVVSGDYQIGAQILAANEDVPEMPTDFHDLIVYEAMSKYGGKSIAPEAMLRAVHEGGRIRAALELEQLPALGYAEPLA